MPSPNLMAAALVRRTQRAPSWPSSATPSACATTRCASPRRSPCSTCCRAAASSPASCAASAASTCRSGVNPTLLARALLRGARPDPARLDRARARSAFEGKHYRVRYANIWPRPLQQPHPPVWLPSQGSPETIRFAAQRPLSVRQRLHARTPTRAACSTSTGGGRARSATARRPSSSASPCRPTWRRPTRRRGAKRSPHILWLFRRGLKIPPHFLAPPGYLSEDALRRFLLAGVRAAERAELRGARARRVHPGRQPGARCAIAWRRSRRELGIGLFIGGGRIGDMSHEHALRSAELFAEHVIPHFRPTPAKRATRPANVAPRR